jgi:hypothetical protein
VPHPPDEEVDMTEVPGTDRDQARENVLKETPLVPQSVEDAGVNGVGEDGGEGDQAKPTPGSTDPVTP